MSLSVLGNGFTSSSISKYHFYILDHFEYIIPGSIERLGTVVFLAFEMLAFLSYSVVHRKKPMVAKVHDLSTFFQKYIVKVFITVCACIISLV